MERPEPLATLTLPYHPCMLKLKPRLTEMGIRLAFSTNSTLQQQLKRRSTTYVQPRGTVYVVNCSACTSVYVGQTGKHVENRMVEHNRDEYETTFSAVHRHNALQGHVMDIRNPTAVYHSDCLQTRLTVESALIHAAPTIPHNTSSASTNSNDLVAHVICRATKFNYEKLARCIPHLNKLAVPRYKRKMFGDQEIVRASPEQRSQAIPTPVSHRTRRRHRERLAARPHHSPPH